MITKHCVLVSVNSITIMGLLLILGARIWLLIGFLFGFGGLIGACWVLFGAYVVPGICITFTVQT